MQTGELASGGSAATVFVGGRAGDVFAAVQPLVIVVDGLCAQQRVT
jgi:hypothetical protein